MPAEFAAPALAATMDGVSFDHEKHSPAFTIIQKDGFNSISLPVIQSDKDFSDGDSSSVKTIITVCSRNESNSKFNSRRRLCKSNDHLVAASLQNLQRSPLKSRHSKSQSSLREDDKSSTLSGKSSMVLSTEDFSEVLNAKLRRIQEQEEEAEQLRQRNAKLNYVNHPKPFITTVKSGEFLMPPPEVAALLGINCNHLAPNPDESDMQCRARFKHLMALNNRRPEVRHQSHNARCPVALRATEEFAYYPSNAPSTITSVSTLDERLRKSRKAEFVQTRTPRFPKKLDPIEGDENVLLNRGDQPSLCSNIIYDKRVVRGTTYTSALIDYDQSTKQVDAKKRQLFRKRAQIQTTRDAVLRSGSPPPVPGRKHDTVQTELYLEELAEKPEELEAATQTDYFLDRPPTPPVCPQISGKDAWTQIEPGELFNYDEEVQPILEVLVGKTIEQAFIEVLEEEEIASLQEQQRRFLELRAAEKVELQRLEEQDRRLKEEKDRRLAQEEDEKQANEETEDRIAATVMLTNYIAELLPAVLESLHMSGILLDDIKTEVEEEFMPWLMKEVKKEVGNVVESRELLTEIIRAILTNRANTYQRLGQEYDYMRDNQSKVLSMDMENVSQLSTIGLNGEHLDSQ